MANPRAFLSSTYLDLRDVRDAIDTFLRDRGFDVRRFERGGVFYDPNLPLDESCYQEVKNTHLVVLVVGGRYGSPATNSPTLARKYTSITRKELETAIAEGIPVLVFVRREVDVELRTYLANPKANREKLKYASVDDTQVFQLLEQVYQRRRGNPIFQYGEPSDIISALDSQLAGLVAQALHERREISRTARIGVNGFKLFYYRDRLGWSQKKLAEAASVSDRLISRLEKIDVSPQMTLGEHLFQSTDRDAVEKIEDALDCKGSLSIGQADDFLSMFIHYYAIYKSPARRRKKGGSHSVVIYEELFDTKTLILDFDGTLTIRSEDDLTSWERLWVSCGYTVNDCAILAQKYVRKGKVSPENHKAWCKDTLTQFRKKEFSKQQLEAAAAEIKLVPGVEEVLRKLHADGVTLFITSGSIREIIRIVLGDLYDLFDEVHANTFVFDREEYLTDIRGTDYDFEGKRDFILRVIEKQDVSPLEVLFVGNSLNDIWASNAGARTLCVNPHFTNPNDTRDWTYCIRKMEDFSLILPYLGQGKPTRG